MIESWYQLRSIDEIMKKKKNPWRQKYFEGLYTFSEEVDVQKKKLSHCLKKDCINNDWIKENRIGGDHIKDDRMGEGLYETEWQSGE